MWIPILALAVGFGLLAFGLSRSDPERRRRRRDGVDGGDWGGAGDDGDCGGDGGGD